MRSWLQGAGPVKDRFNMGENPQYRLSFTNEHEKGAVWVLLSRHITSIDDFENNKEFITAHIYNGGDRIHYPDKPLVQVQTEPARSAV